MSGKVYWCGPIVSHSLYSCYNSIHGSCPKLQMCHERQVTTSYHFIIWQVKYCLIVLSVTHSKNEKCLCVSFLLYVISLFLSVYNTLSPYCEILIESKLAYTCIVKELLLKTAPPKGAPNIIIL